MGITHRHHGDTVGVSRHRAGVFQEKVFEESFYPVVLISCSWGTIPGSCRKRSVSNEAGPTEGIGPYYAVTIKT